MRSGILIIDRFLCIITHLPGVLALSVQMIFHESKEGPQCILSSCPVSHISSASGRLYFFIG